MEKILFLFAILASAFAGHMEERFSFREDCSSLQQRCVNNSIRVKDKACFPVCAEETEPCRKENVVFSSVEEALQELSKTISLKIGTETKKIPVMVSDAGKIYIIIQRRLNGVVDFHRSWKDYVKGFGNPEGEYWIGLNALNKLTSSEEFVLTIFLETYKNINAYARYGTFRVEGPENMYQLNVDDYSGTAGDALKYHKSMRFSTHDNDNDRSNDNCALKFKGAWWYNSCFQSNLNGKYYESTDKPKDDADGISWLPFVDRKESAKKSIMALSLK